MANSGRIKLVLLLALVGTIGIAVIAPAQPTTGYTLGLGNTVHHSDIIGQGSTPTLGNTTVRSDSNSTVQSLDVSTKDKAITDGTGQANNIAQSQDSSAKDIAKDEGKAKDESKDEEKDDEENGDE